ncbi:winged helix-turn-helix domain-containing protein [Acerihabitans arboris]|uniref:Cytoplasmic protein n=1 Tax=Acerihabitans arboris TaxID=2691583 RepID=A0A845SQ84_9GAMM|nr:crosslink repair DNA glycosylase YcaQ family protein [Acerihabitans arboris]NDL64751.1 cytoplasmic protein [Acerihabitans arboris]
MTKSSIPVTARQARAIWLRAQRLDVAAPFGEGPDAVRLATGHLGYVQIDTINVIERSHHHILYSRIPAYRRADLELAQSGAKSVFEYWTHALAYVPTADYRMFLPAMNQFRAKPHASYADLDAQHYAALLKRIRDDGALSIRDINDDVLVEKTHPWGSRKPSRRALRYGFFSGDLTVSKRTGMLKSYDLSARHFGWPRRPRPATEQQYAHYLVERALRSQGMVSLDSICFGNVGAKGAVRTLIDAAEKKKQLVPVHIDNHAKIQHWTVPAALEQVIELPPAPRTAILSPFDPLVIQRKRLQLFFGYEHRFEAYVPADKRVLGYFALPVLVGDDIVAALDLKMDRPAGRLLVQKWTWFTVPRPELQVAVDEALGRFERFQKG